MPKLKKGLFITFEGPEGSGKSTQSKMLVDHLIGQGYDVIATREPGGTKLGQLIRQILLDPENTGMARLAEILLFSADRAQHVQEKILPALEAQKIVICDRYVDSTTAYQIYGRGLEPKLIKTLNKISSNDLLPLRTYLLDIPVDQGLKRATRITADRFEKEYLSFHEQVRKGYLQVAADNKKRIKISSGLDPIELVHQAIVKDIEHLLKQHAL